MVCRGSCNPGHDHRLLDRERHRGRCSLALCPRRPRRKAMSTGRDLRSLPKAHLHLHLEGAMRRETLVELAAHYGVPLPPVGDYNSFTEFSAIYEAVCAVLRTHNDLRRLVREVVEDAAASGAVWLEMGVRPTLHRGKFKGDAEVLEVLLDEGRSAGRELGLGVGALMTVDRTDRKSVV